MSKGRFGVHGGQYMPETLMNAVIELEEAYNYYKNDPDFNAELDELYRNYSPASTTEREINLIPYFAYANRGESDMQVWLRVK